MMVLFLVIIFSMMNAAVVVVASFGAAPTSLSSSPSAAAAIRCRFCRRRHPQQQSLGRLRMSLMEPIQHISTSVQIAVGSFFGFRSAAGAVTVEEIVRVCDALDAVTVEGEELAGKCRKQRGDPSMSTGVDGTRSSNNDNNSGFLSFLSCTVTRSLRMGALKFQRYELLVKLMQHDYDAYIATASFLSPSRIARMELPNVQDVPFNTSNNQLEKDASAVANMATTTSPVDERGVPLVADCTLQNKEFSESLLDRVLLSVFRKLVTENTGGVRSDKPGILGLVEQGRTYMLQPDQTPEAQHKMVSDTLAGLMTPVLPIFYRIFMSGIVPQLGTRWDGKQLGPWFYAPLLTSIVTPTFFAFLVGPSHPNRRRDGQPGGLVVEKCKFLQESGCKGLCLHQCKLPAQQFFREGLGLPLTVQPNFVTQECQWSFGETPLPVEQDPSFPRGCLVGCASRKAVTAMERPGYVNLCN
jgi:Beta-carotene isomerase D27-like, C-terminal